MLAALTLLTGCLAPKPIDSGDTDDSGGGGGGVSVFDVNDGSASGTVTVTGVVTSPLTRDGEGFFIADPAGGANSGLFVWRALGMGDLLIQQGDEVRITGEVNEFYDWTEFVVSTVDQIEVTGEATVPAPADLGSGADVDWESYESVLVSLSTQEVVSVNEFNTGTLSGGVALDDGFVYLEYDCGGTFESVTGILFYSYEEYSVNPRTTEELVGYTAGPPVTGTVAELQAGSVCGSEVTVSDLVVTSTSFGDDGTSTFFTQDAGGENHGLTIFVPEATYEATVGDLLTITGSATEFYGLTEMRVNDVADIVVAGTAEPVVTEIATAPADWEPWEGQLVSIGPVTVNAEADEFGNVPTDWNIHLVDLLHDAEPEVDDVFPSITGVVYYEFETWKLLPRSSADVAR